MSKKRISHHWLCMNKSSIYGRLVAGLEAPEKLEGVCPKCHESIDKCKCIQAAADEIFGTKIAGYATHENGLSFCCHDCEHFDGSKYCNQSKVLQDPDMKKEDGKAVVAPDACCSFWHPESTKEA